MKLKNLFFFERDGFVVFIPQNPDGSFGQCWARRATIALGEIKRDLMTRGIHQTDHLRQLTDKL